MTLSTSLMSTELQPSSHPRPFALMSQCQDGMERAATGLIMDFQCMLPSTGNRKMDVRSKLLPAAEVGS